MRDFTPYIHVEGESTVPSSITIFAVTGGRWNHIEVPEEFAELPLVEQMPALAGLMRAYLDKYEGQCPFFGRVTGFRFVGRDHSLRFTANGVFIERDEGQFCRPHAELRIGNKRVESLFR